MATKPFSRSELEVVSITPARKARPAINNYTYPITPKEAQRSAMELHPWWQLIGLETQQFNPRIIPDNTARAIIFETKAFNPEKDAGGKDMFGVEWTYEPSVGGSMVIPGNPRFTDANEWADKIIWPDVSSWGWEESARENKDYFSSELFNITWFPNGWFERLITFMDFENAILALVDDEQQDAVKAFFEKLSDLYIEIFDHYLKYFPQIDGFYIHDDWGSQKNTFFSPVVAEEMIVPYMKKVTDFIRSKDRIAELHSCGQNLDQVPNYIKAGWHAWNPQGNVNDTEKIYDLYGDKILVGIMPEPVDGNASEDEIRVAAQAFANRYCKSDKPSVLCVEGRNILTPIYREELYIQSRINYDM